jgi:hypothetical protein
LLGKPFLGRTGSICPHSRNDAGGNLHGGAGRPTEADYQSSAWACDLVQNNAGDGHHRRDRNEESTGSAEQSRYPTWSRANVGAASACSDLEEQGQINPQIEAGGPVKHHGQDGNSRTDQVDVYPTLIRIKSEGMIASRF